MTSSRLHQQRKNGGSANRTKSTTFLHSNRAGYRHSLGSTASRRAAATPQYRSQRTDGGLARRERWRQARRNGEVRIIRRRPQVPLLDFSAPLRTQKSRKSTTGDSALRQGSLNKSVQSSPYVAVPETSKVIHGNATRGR